MISTGFHHTNGALSFCQSAIEIMTKCLSYSALKDDCRDLSADEIPETPEKQNPELGSGLESSRTERPEPNRKSDEGFLLSIWSSLASSLYNHILKVSLINPFAPVRPIVRLRKLLVIWTAAFNELIVLFAYLER